MNGDGFGTPPWGPADPVPERADTQALPGLGSVSPASAPAQPPANHPRDKGFTDAFPAPDPARPGRPGRPDPARLGREAPTERDIPRPDRGNNGPDGSAPDGTEDDPGTARGKRRRSFWRELPVLIVIALVLALVIKAFAVQAFYIPSGSMQNTLEINDRVLINKIVYHLRPIHRGDIVVFDGTGSWDFNTPPKSSNIFSKAVDELEGLVGISQDSSIYIKRVVGIPGDHVVCCNTHGQLTVNGVPLSESDYLYPGNQPSTQKFSITVPAGRLWVMGDHREISDDSRGHLGDPGGGTIPVTGVLGRAFVIIWPPSHWGILNIPATFEQPQLNASSAAGGNAAAGGSSAALAAAMANGTPVQPTASPLPLALGFIGAVPVTWLQRRLRARSQKPRPYRVRRRPLSPGGRPPYPGVLRARWQKPSSYRARKPPPSRGDDPPYPGVLRARWQKPPSYRARKPPLFPGGRPPVPPGVRAGARTVLGFRRGSRSPKPVVPGIRGGARDIVSSLRYAQEGNGWRTRRNRRS